MTIFKVTKVELNASNNANHPDVVFLIDDDGKEHVAITQAALFPALEEYVQMEYDVMRDGRLKPVIWTKYMAPQVTTEEEPPKRKPKIKDETSGE